eukprot:scaffold469142_cov20-Prasinocladus_malaysianus.AAC.1
MGEMYLNWHSICLTTVMLAANSGLMEPLIDVAARVTDEGLARLAGLPSLAELSLNGCLQSFQKLSMAMCPSVHRGMGDCAEAVPANSRLRIRA